MRAARWERGSGRRSQKRQWVSQTISRSNSCRSHVRPEQTQTQAELSASCDLVVGRTLPPRPRHPRGSCQRRSSRPRRCCPRQAGACSLLPWAPRPPRRAAAAPRSAASLRGGAWAARGSGALCHVRLMSTTLPASSRAGRARNVASANLRCGTCPLLGFKVLCTALLSAPLERPAAAWHPVCLVDTSRWHRVELVSTSPPVPDCPPARLVSNLGVSQHMSPAAAVPPPCPPSALIRAHVRFSWVGGAPHAGRAGRTSPSIQKTRIRKTRGVRVSSWSDVAGSSIPAPHYTGVTARSAPRLRRNFAPGGGEGWGRGRAWGGDLCACARAGSGPPTWCVVTLGLGCSSLVYLSLCLTERHRVTRAPTRLQPHT